MRLFDSLAKWVTLSAQVISKEKISAQVYHLKIKGSELQHLPYIPGYHVRILVGYGKNNGFRDNLRTYSIWNYNVQEGSMDIAICTHSAGVGAQWIRDLEIGEEIRISKPKGKFTLDTTGDYYLFLGDLTSLGHLYEIRRHLAPTHLTHGLIYTPYPDDLFPDLNGTLPFTLLPNTTYPSTATLQDYLKDYIAQQSGKGIVYIGGDGRVCVELHQFFRKVLQWSPEQIKTKPFWHPAKKGLE